MKHLVVFATAAVVVSLVSCGPSAEEAAATRDKFVADSLEALKSAEKTYTVDVTASKVSWAGTAVGIKTHTGTVNFTSGTFTTKGPTLTAGEFVVDMKDSYVMNDTNYAPDGSKQGTRGNLADHLKGVQFFAVDSFPTASLKITGVNGDKATADLTVRGKTHTENITDIVITENSDGTAKATGKLVFDRQKYGVSWDSGSKDYVVSNDITLTVDLVGKAQ